MNELKDALPMIRILLIEDNPEFGPLLGRILKGEGYEVVLARNGHEALEAMAKGAFTLLITDLIIPGPEGIEVILEARALAPRTSIIAMSGGSLEGGRDYLPLAEKLGASALLRKPFGRDELLATVNRVLGVGRLSSVR